jgi:DNA-binding CsgD family transcriptional regulator
MSPAAAVVESIPTPALDGLTAREREILARVVAGESNRDIAKAL